MGLSFAPGDVLCAKYKVEGVLGAGGMGIVIAAEHLLLGERVALKILRPDLAHEPQLVARFEREARAAAKIRSQHVARVSDVGRLDSGPPFMVMEYLRGRDLHAHLGQHGPLQLQEAADYLLQACEAIAEAHALGIVHRDLKPENLFLTTLPDGMHSIKVLDFGISKVSWLHGSSGAQPHATIPQAIMGTPLYMSPEQLRSARDVDARTDVWSLGVILYELLTRKTPFVAATLPQLCTAILEAPPAPLARDRPDLPPAVGELIARCLRKPRDERTASVAQLARALAPFASTHGQLSAERIARIAAGGRAAERATAVPLARQALTVQRGPPPARIRRVRALALAAAVVATIAGAVLWLQTRTLGSERRAPDPDSQPALQAKPRAEPAPDIPAAGSTPLRLPAGVIEKAPQADPDPTAREAPAEHAPLREASAEPRRYRAARDSVSAARKKPAARPAPARGVDPDRPLGGRL